MPATQFYDTDFLTQSPLWLTSSSDKIHDILWCYSHCEIWYSLGFTWFWIWTTFLCQYLNEPSTTFPIDFTVMSIFCQLNNYHCIITAVLPTQLILYERSTRSPIGYTTMFNAINFGIRLEYLNSCLPTFGSVKPLHPSVFRLDSSYNASTDSWLGHCETNAFVSNEIADPFRVTILPPLYIVYATSL